MSKKRTNAEHMSPLTPADLERFRRDAHAAVKRRGRGFFFEQWAHSFELILMGAVPIVGMALFDWSGMALLVFMLAGAWTAVACDAFKYVLLRPVVDREAEAYTNDQFVWVVVEALQKKTREVPTAHAGAAYLPGVGLFVDLLFGGISTVVIVAALAVTEAGFPGDVLGDAGYVLGLVAFIVCQVLLAIWLVLEHRLGHSEGPVKLHAGLRGVGLFFLMFIVVVISDKLSEKAAVSRIVMIVTNSLIILVGVLNLVGMRWVRQETIWLRDYLGKRQAGRGR